MNCTSVKQNKPHSIHLRLTEAQYQFCVDAANTCGVGVPDYIRMMVNTLLVTSHKIDSKLGDLYENKQNDIECKL